jgi:hypothetical protein
MAQFKDLTDDQLEALGQRLIRNVQARVSRQVPSPVRNPFAKGTLERSVRYSWKKLGDLSWGLQIDYAEHGKYVNFGTRSFFNHAMMQQSVFGYEFRGYSRGKGGVRPQGWLSLRGDKPVYEAIVEAEVRLTFEEFVRNTITPLTKQTN